MNDVSFDALSRRASLVALGAAGLAAAFAAPIADAKNTTKKKARKKCKKQVGQCLVFLEGRCAGDPACIANSVRCCPFLGNCDVIGFFACFS